MEIVAPKKNLERLLSRCQGVADKKSTMPVLANVLLSAEGSSLTISATDLQLTISGSIEAEVKKPGTVALPARDVHDRVKAMPDGPIRIAVTNGSATTVQAVGSARRYTVHGLPGSDFPQLPEQAPDAAMIDISVAMLQKLVKRTIFSISTDETRPHLNSALFECRPSKGSGPGTVRMVTTDGHRLSKMELPLEGLRADTTMLIPHKAMQELRKLFDDIVDNRDTVMVSIAQTGPNAFFKLAGVRFSVKLIDAQFPPYEQVIPGATDRMVVAGRTAFMDALKAVSLAASDRTYGVKLSVSSGALRISSESPESGNGFDELPVDYDGPEISVGFNAQYLQHVLAAMDVEEEVSLGLSGELDPAVLKPADSQSTEFVAVVMPMRI